MVPVALPGPGSSLLQALSAPVTATVAARASTARLLILMWDSPSGMYLLWELRSCLDAGGGDAAHHVLLGEDIQRENWQGRQGRPSHDHVPGCAVTTQQQR